MVVPCVYRFTGQKKYIKLLKRLLDIEHNLSERHSQEIDESLKYNKREPKT